MAPATVVVNVRELNGTPLDAPALVKLFSNSMTFNEISATRDNATATFQNVRPGEYRVEVTAPGYKTVTDRVSVANSGMTYPVYVYIPSESDVTPNKATGGGIVMTPKLRGEVEKGLNALRKQQYDAAEECFTRAAKLAPSNPDVLYLLAVTQHSLKRPDAARENYQAALALQPAHERSLLGLGELEIEEGDPTRAAITLEKAYQINGADWRTHLLLAYAYLGEKRYDQAQVHAQQAADLNGTQPAAAHVLLARIREARGENEEAKKELERVIESFPGDPAAQEARLRLARMTSARPTSASETAAAAPKPAGALPLTPDPLPERAWAPPDVDSKGYQMAPGVACPQAQVLSQAQVHMMQQAANFDRFAATEHIVHQEINSHGLVEQTKARDFWYVVFVKHEGSSFFLEETRDGDEGVQSFPTSLATTGLVGLGVAVLQPNYAGDFAYRCEGLSEWRGQAAWELRFEQKEDMPPRVRIWRKGGAVYPIPLKGRLWISASSYDLLHMETDLREPVDKLRLEKDHLAIDYGPVNFENGASTLWLPWTAEMYMEVHGKRYHHQHTLTNYVLFSVKTKETVGQPTQGTTH